MQARFLRHNICCCAVTLLLLTLPGSCGFGTAGVIASASGSGSTTTNAPATAAGFQVLGARSSPATLRLTVTDAESDSVEVEFLYSIDGGEEQLLEHAGQNPVRLASSPTGVDHQLSWDFALESGIGNDSLTKSVILLARSRNGTQLTTTVDLGNDAPTAEVVVPAATVTAIAPFAIRLADSSTDLVDARIEFRTMGVSPGPWQPARPAGLEATQATPDAAITGVSAAPAPGSTLQFFWDTAFDLPGLERDVQLRCIPDDGLDTGEPFETPVFRVDNNARPIVQINEGLAVAGNDRRRTIPIAVTVQDEESDPVDVVLQWKRQGDATFPDLGTGDPAELRRLLADSSWRREHQVVSTPGLAVDGDARFLGARQVRTTAFARGEDLFVTNGLTGRTVEILRPASGPTVQPTTAWTTSPFTRPVAILPIDRGHEAIVLDDTGGSAAVFVVQMSDGARLRTLAAGLAGTPTALCRSAMHDTLLVATQASSGWLIHEVPVQPSAGDPPTLRASRPPSVGNSALRGIGSRGATCLLATSGDQLLQIDWDSSGGSTAFPLLRGLSEPTGIALDLRDNDAAWIAERTFVGGPNQGRIARWDLLNRTPTATLNAAQTPLRPSAIAFDERARYLFVLGEATGGASRVLRRYAIGAINGAGSAWSVNLSTETDSIGIGGTAMWMAAASASGAISVQGGASHRRTVTAYDPSTMTVTLDADVLAPPAGATLRFYAADGRGLPATPAGHTELLVCDTDPFAGLGPVLLRAVAMDTELGAFAQSQAGIPVERDLFDTVTTPAQLGICDLDGDGDMDLVTPTGPRLQTTARTFSAGAAVGASLALDWNGDGRNDLIEFGAQTRIRLQTTAGGFSATPNATLSIAADTAADIDGDGRVDLALRGTPSTIWFQTSPGVFGAPVTAGASVANTVQTTLADMTGDGLLDIVFLTSSFSSLSVSVGVFAQTSARTFAATPTSFLSIGNDAPADRFHVADLDRDGRNDLVVSHPLFHPGSLAPFVQAHTTIRFNGDNNTLRFDRLGLGLYPTGVFDLDGDGMPDIAGQSGSLRQLRPREFVDCASTGTSAAQRDVDGDGCPDGVASASVAFTRGTSTLTSSSIAMPGRLLADFNADQRVDCVAVVAQSLRTFVNTYLDQLAFSFPPTPDATFFYGGGDAEPSAYPVVGDRDGDGRTDLITFLVGDSGAFTTFGNNGQIVQSDSGFFLFGYGTGLLDDVDGDGRLDLVKSINHQQANLSRVRIVPTTAPATTINIAAAPASTFVHSLATGDFNGDSIRDLAVGGENGRVFVFPGTATGFATSPLTLGAATSTLSEVEAADVDGDGYDDLLVTRFSGLTPGSTVVHYGSPTGLPLASVSVGVSGCLGVRDLDGDRLADLMSLNGAALARQVAPRVFVVVPNGLALSAGFRWALRDVDHDGEFDAVFDNRTHFGDR